MCFAVNDILKYISFIRSHSGLILFFNTTSIGVSSYDSDAFDETMPWSAISRRNGLWLILIRRYQQT